MQANLLHVIVPISNPVLWKSRITLYNKFEQHMLDSGVNLYVVECALGERPFQLNANPSVTHIGVRHNTLCWHKESLVNIGIARLPESAKYIAVADGDIIFRNPNWASDTVHALQQYHVIQPWEHAYDLGPGGGHLQVHTSFCSLVAKGQPISATWNNAYTYGHPGFFWAWTRQALEWTGGLIDFAALGSADHNMALGLLGRISETFPPGLSEEFTRLMRVWESRAKKFLGVDHIGYIPGTIEHMFHGSKNDPVHGRKYRERWDILREVQFNPLTDIKNNTYGVTELSGNKPGLERAIDQYMRNRAEDSNRA